MFQHIMNPAMATNDSQLCDRAALERFRKRAGPDAMFLHDEAQLDLQDRLTLVNRAFNAPAIVSGHPAIWCDFQQEAHVIADTDTLDLEPGAHDLLIHAMSLHWANDPVGQLIQMRRALKPDGLCLVIAPGGQTLNELRSALSTAEARVSGGLSPRILPMADIRDLGALMQRAGFALPVVDSFEIKAEYDTLHHLMTDLRNMGETNALSARQRKFTRKSVFQTAEQIYRENFPGPAKPLIATYELMVMTGWAPSETQPKALRPGSAQKRLADALGTKETPLSD